MVTGNDVHRLEMWSLLFRDGNVTGDGGALAVTGQSSPRIRLSTFLNNTASGSGGAVYFSQDTPLSGLPAGPIAVMGNTFGSTTDPAEGNHAGGDGGAVSVETPGQGQNSSYTDNVFAGNTAEGNGGAFAYELDPGGSENFSVSDNEVTGNSAAGSGGGGYVVVDQSLLRVDNELYEGNSVEPLTPSPPSGDHLGGGLFLRGGIQILRNNVFRGNSIESFATGDLGGGGLAMLGDGADASTEFTRVEGNTVAGPPPATSFESEGGGVFFSSPGARWYGFLDAVAGNSVGAGGSGGGIYTGAAIEPVTLELGEVTVANNTVGAGGTGAGLAGGGSDELIARNSIFWNTPNHTGYSTLDVTYSVICSAPGTPLAGAGNICVNPKLVGGTDVHQTQQSPTIDRGNDAYFGSEGGGERPETDYEGDPRPTDGDGDGHTIDMGADETPAGFLTQQPPPPPPTPQCSDGADNDGDGAVDLADPGCLAGPADDNEGDETERDLVLCGQRTISLVRADLRGRRVVLSGVVAASVAGQRVRLSVRYLGRRAKAEQLGSVTPGADGRFQARVKKPPLSLLNVARYRATVGRARSVELKLPQSLASTSLRQVGGGMLELRGQVQRSLLGKRNAVVVKRILCGRYTTVGRAKPTRRGAYAVRFPAPVSASGGAALYRAETRVLARPGSRRYVKQFARAIGITF
jgi:predicted outer membrane repeat protein